MTNKSPVFETLEPWTWPLPFDHETAVDAFLDDLIGRNEGAKVDNDERRLFMQELRSSFSLNNIEKRRVITSFRTLSRFQIDELVKVFTEERGKFTELEKEHPEDIEKLFVRMEFEWALLMNPTHGALAFLSRYVFPEEAEVTPSVLTGMFDSVSHVLTNDKRYDDLIALIQHIFSASKKISAKDRENLVNSGLHALARSGQVRSSSEMIKHPIGKSIKKLSKSKNRKARAFLEFCSVTYPMDIYGIREGEKSEGKRLCTAYRQTYTKAADLSSQVSYYYLLSGDTKRALKCAEISLKRYNKDFSVDAKIFQRFAEHGGRNEYIQNNLIRNVVRYFALLDCFNGFDADLRKVHIISEFFKDPIEHFNKWRSDKHIQQLTYFIPLYFFAEDKTLAESSGVKNYLNDKAEEYEKFLFRLAFSRPLRGGELEGIKDAMRSLNAKTDLLTFALIVRAISTSRLQMKADRRFVCDTLMNAYVEVVQEKGWYLNEETCLFEL